MNMSGYITFGLQYRHVFGLCQMHNKIGRIVVVGTYITKPREITSEFSDWTMVENLGGKKDDKW